MEASNWRSQLDQTTRRNVVNKIIASIKEGVSSAGQHEVYGVGKVAASFEEKIFKEADSKEEYIQKIFLKLRSSQNKVKQKVANSLSSDASYTCESHSDQASCCIQPQMQEQGQCLSYSLANKSAHKRLLSENVQNNLASAGVQSSSNSTMIMASVTSSTHIPVLHIVDQNPNLQISSGISRSFVGNLPEQAQIFNNFTTSQRQLHERESSIQQPTQSLVQQHPQPVLMQQQHNSVIHQRRAPILLQPKLLSQQQRPNAFYTQQAQSNGTQNIVTDMQHQNQRQSGVPPSALLRAQTEKSQSQPTEQRLTSQIQSQPAKLQPLPTPLQQDKLQRQRVSDSMFQTQNVNENKKQCPQFQSVLPAMSSMALDSAPKAIDESKGDWLEELYQRIETLKETFLPDLKEMLKKIAVRLQMGDCLPRPLMKEDHTKLKRLHFSIRQTLQFLQLGKCQLTLDHKQKMGQLENLIDYLLNVNSRLKPISSLWQTELSSLQLQSLQPQPQNPRFPLQESQIGRDMQTLYRSHGAMGKNSVTASEDGSQILTEVTSLQKRRISSPPPVTNLDKEQGSALSPPILSQSGGIVPHQNINPLNSNSRVLQNMHIVQQKEHQMLNEKLGKQLMKQSEQLVHQHSRQHQHANLQARKKPSLREMNDINSMEMGQGTGIKAEILLQNHSTRQRPVNNSLQAVKSEPLSPVSSSQHYSPLRGQGKLQTSLRKPRDCLQYPNPRPAVPSPLSPSTASPIRRDHDKLTSGDSSIANSGHNGLQKTTGAVVQGMPFIISTPGLSISQVLGESTDPDGNRDNISTMDFCESSLSDKPLQRLVNTVRSMSDKALRASISDMESYAGMVERTAGSLPGNGCRSAIGEDLAAMTKSHWQGRSNVSVAPSNIASSAGSTNCSLKQPRDSDASDLESTATCHTKRPRIEANYSLLKEIWEMNNQLIHTVIDVMHEGVNSAAVFPVTEFCEGTIVICSFSAVALCPMFNLQRSSAKMPPIMPLRLLVPADYPALSPVLLDKSPTELSMECEDLLVKAMLKLRVSLRRFAQPISLGEIAKSWDVCARSVISEYAERNGGGNFSSRYGTWENCLAVI